MSINTTGLPKTEDYLLGRGRIMVAALSSGLPDADGFRHLGNAPDFTVNVDNETLEHFSSLAGKKTLDARVVITQEVGLTFNLEEFNFDNLADFLSGAAVAAGDGDTNPATAGFGPVDLTTAVKKGRYYQIKDANGLPAMDVETANVTLTHDPGGAADVLVEDTDYTLDEKNGIVHILNDAGATTVVEGNEIEVTLAADAGAVDWDEVRGLTQSEIEVALKFILINAQNSDKEIMFDFHKVRLIANGDMSAIGDELAQMPFSGSAEKNTTADSDSPTVTIRTHANS